ncbi:UNVERIFIED_CONTAM: hypothetical protein H355_015265 [Colinus virginianus]|nr:hypothetical protein H355_015265 [Colinus virginianus]
MRITSMAEECQNYIRVLLVGGNHLFTCGTNAFTPICTNRTLNNLTEIHDQISGMARCPYSPQHNSTALLTSSGELYAATAMDFPGRDPAIYRSLGALPPLRTAQYNSKWLNEPNFVSSYDIGNFTYFFFRENAVEHDCGKTVFSRAARVCKNDIGGKFVLEDTWTTFMKARLNCSRPGEIPFYYNELQSTFFLPELDLIYGIFTTNVNSIAASAVCVFNLSAITQAFNGPFKYQENSRSAWLPYPNPNPNFQCGTMDQGLYVNLTERNLQDAQKFFLMHEVVQPVIPIPYFMEDNSRFSHVVVDVVQGKDMLFHIIYLATDYGTIKKVLAPMNQTSSSCLLEEIELLPKSQREPIRSLQILHSQSVLFVGLQEHVIKVPLKRCLFYKTFSACIGSQDPYCGWDMVMKKCTTLEESLSMSQWEQSITVCPASKFVSVPAAIQPLGMEDVSVWDRIVRRAYFLEEESAIVIVSRDYDSVKPRTWISLFKAVKSRVLGNFSARTHPTIHSKPGDGGQFLDDGWYHRAEAGLKSGWESKLQVTSGDYRAGTAMSICCAHLMCFGQAGVHGNAALLSAEEGFRLGGGHVKMVPTVLAAA